MFTQRGQHCVNCREIVFNEWDKEIKLVNTYNYINIYDAIISSKKIDHSC